MVLLNTLSFTKNIPETQSSWVLQKSKILNCTHLPRPLSEAALVTADDPGLREEPPSADCKHKQSPVQSYHLTSGEGGDVRDSGDTGGGGDGEEEEGVVGSFINGIEATGWALFGRNILIH